MRIKLLTLIVSLFLGSSVVVAAPPSLWNQEIPPVRFQGPAMAVTVFLPPYRVREECQKRIKETPPEGIEIKACRIPPDEPGGISLLVLPDPCLLAPQEYYAKVLCHEIAHINGWPNTHGD